MVDDNQRKHTREALEIQVGIYRKMSPAQKLRTMEDLYLSAMAIKEAGLRAQHSEWSPQKIKQAVRESMMYGRD